MFNALHIVNYNECNIFQHGTIHIHQYSTKLSYKKNVSIQNSFCLHNILYVCVLYVFIYIYICMYVNECATVNGYISCHFLATFCIKYFYLSLTHTHRQAIKITHIQMYSDTNTQVSIIHHPVCFFHFQQQHTITFLCIYSTKIWVRSSTSCIDYS